MFLFHMGIDHEWARIFMNGEGRRMRGGGIVCGGFSGLSEPGYNGWGRGVEGAVGRGSVEEGF